MGGWEDENLMNKVKKKHNKIEGENHSHTSNSENNNTIKNSNRYSSLSSDENIENKLFRENHKNIKNNNSALKFCSLHEHVIASGNNNSTSTSEFENYQNTANLMFPIGSSKHPQTFYVGNQKEERKKIIDSIDEEMGMKISSPSSSFNSNNSALNPNL